ncbi:recombinase RecA [Candidatus Gracilibacteria bacterium]|nr:recombinase RecA [Candidatus Gracilibacteria bacterium]
MAKKKTITKNIAPSISHQKEKKKMADLIVSQIKSTFGQGSIMKMNEITDQDIEVVSTGSLALDLATGVGGFPKGRIIEIYGPESSGKTSIALSAIAQSQQEGGIAAFIDAEHALDPDWSVKLGVNLDDLYVSQPSNGEEALEIVDNLVRSNAFDIIVVDSVAALVPKSEIEGNMGDSQMGVQARLMSQALRKLTGAISKSKTTVVFINQIRLKIGVMFGSPETTTGGQALKFFSSQRFDIRKIGTLKSGTENVGTRVKVKVVKNKMAAPFKVVEFDMMFEEPGVISLAGEIIDIGINYNTIEKTGNTYTLKLDGENPIKLGVGRDNAKKVLYENKDKMKQAKKEILEAFKQSVIEGKLKSGSSVTENNKQDEIEEKVEDTE